MGRCVEQSATCYIIDIAGELGNSLIVCCILGSVSSQDLDQRYGKGLRIGFTGAILMSLGIVVFVGFLSDLGPSEVQATDDGVARAFYGHGVGASLWYQDIVAFSFIPRASSGKPLGLLVLVTRAHIVTLGVPDRISRSELVEFFQRHGVQEAQEPNKALHATAAVQGC